MQVYADFISKNGEGHRFDLGRTAGKRLLWLDETLLGMSYDEARLSLLASGSILTVEIKNGRDGVQFINRAKLLISGNHRPHFVSGEAGGLASRLMTLEAKGKNLRDSHIDKHEMPQIIAAEEGPAFLAWALQNAHLDLQADGHARFYRLMEPAKAATKEYLRQDSTLVQWAYEHAHFGPELEAYLKELHRAYMAYAKEHNERQNLRPQDLKKQLMMAFPELKAEKRNTRGLPNRVVVLGIGLNPSVASGPNIVEFPTMTKKGEEVNKGKEDLND
jgi:phage/plasmid-associated DNA primase